MYYLPREHVTVCEDTSIRTVSLSKPTNLKSNQIAVLKTVLFFSFFKYFARMPETFSTSSALNPRLIYNVESVCVNPSSPMNFLLTIWNCFDLLSNSLNLFLKEMYGQQSGEFVCGYWGLKG